jgi:hypothetical protein
MKLDGERLNYRVLIVFAPLLILVGVLGFVVPPSAALTSGAPAYNVFHLASGALGLAAALSRGQTFIRGFNLSFGLVELYQAAAGLLHLFPEQHFRWTRADDALHIIVGPLLVCVGLYGRPAREAGRS